MINLVSIFFITLLFGQFGGVQLLPGVTVFIHDIFAGLVLIFFLVRKFQRKEEIQGNLLQPLGIFTGIAIVSLLINVLHFSYIQLFLGSLYLWRLLLYAGLYVVVRNESLSVKFWLKGLYYVGVGIAALGFIQYIFYPSLRSMLSQGWDEHFYRLFSTLLDPNFTGLFLVLSFFLGIYLYTDKWKTQIRIGQLVIGMSLILTYSRSSFLAFIAGLVVFVILSKKKTLLIALVLGALIYAGLPTHGIDVNRLFRLDSTRARVNSYTEDIAFVKQSPFIGIGFNTLRYLAGREKILDSDGITSRDAGGLNSSILVVLITTGITGLVAFIFLLYRMFVLIVGKQDTLGFVGLACLIAILIHSLFNNSFFYSWILIWLWIFLGSIEKRNLSAKGKKTHF